MGSQFNTALWGGGVPAGTVTVSGRSLVYGALRLLGVLRPGHLANTDSNTDGLSWLNELLDSWAIERLMVKIVERTVLAMTGASSYVILPHRIEGAGYVYAGMTSEYPLKVYELREWQGISQKTLVGAPAGVYPDYTVAEGALYPYPQPADGDLILYQWKPIEAFGDLDTTYVLSAGYALALRYCLADQIAPAFQIIAKIQVPQATLDKIERKATEYKARIKSANSVPPPMQWDNPFQNGGRMDIMTGELL